MPNNTIESFDRLVVSTVNLLSKPLYRTFTIAHTPYATLLNVVVGAVHACIDSGEAEPRNPNPTLHNAGRPPVRIPGVWDHVAQDAWG